MYFDDNFTNENKARHVQLNCWFIKITSDVKILFKLYCNSFSIVHGRLCILKVSCVFFINVVLCSENSTLSVSRIILILFIYHSSFKGVLLIVQFITSKCF